MNKHHSAPRDMHQPCWSLLAVLPERKAWLNSYDNKAVALMVTKSRTARARIAEPIQQCIFKCTNIKKFTLMRYKTMISVPIIVITMIININCKLAAKDSRNTQPEQKAPDKRDLEIPRIDFVSTVAVQPHATDPNVIWFDDFDEKKQYMDSLGDTDKDMSFGENGASMIAGFEKGDVDGKGNRKVAFGDYPGNGAIRKDRQFDEVYWRIYVKHEHGWEGAPAKMSRATSIVSENWNQAMIAHVWSGAENSLTLDPARGVEGQTDQVKTTRYNDFENLVWLGNKPSSKFKISATEESGYWVLVESRAKLNTPGKSDGVNQLWIDGRLEAERVNLNFRGSYTQHGINAVFLESYWNNGSPKKQGRWFENFVISTQPIGPVVCPANPVLYKTPYVGPEELKSWEVELASDYNGEDVVFQSKILGPSEKVTIETRNGKFTGSLAGNTSLASGKTYFCRVRQKSTTGELSDWSRWHQGFKVESLLPR